MPSPQPTYIECLYAERVSFGTVREMEREEGQFRPGSTWRSRLWRIPHSTCVSSQGPNQETENLEIDEKEESIARE